MSRDLRLTKELADQIVFGMENQDHLFYFDIDSQTIVENPPEPTAHSEDGQDERYIRLPEWRSVDGYNLMTRFVATLRNPIYRERLRAILASGRGVFRQFKDALGERPDIERLWLNYKQRAMREVVAEWANDLRELWGLERLEMAEEETEELVGVDFMFSDGGARGAELVRDLDRIAFEENLEGQPPQTIDLLYRYHRAGKPSPSAPESRILLAETPSQEFAGFLWALRLGEEGTLISVVAQLYIPPEYRGIGIARALLQRHLAYCHENGYSDLLVDLVGTGCDLESDLSEYGLARNGVTMRVQLDRWAREQGRA